MEDHCKMAWRTMEALMSTHLGHSALFNLCQFIQSRETHADVALVRGAVFYVGMSLWGSRCVKTMQGCNSTDILWISLTLSPSSCLEFGDMTDILVPKLCSSCS